MPDVPKNSHAIRSAAGGRAAAVAAHLEALGSDLSTPRPAVLPDVDRVEGVALFAEAAAALRDLAAELSRLGADAVAGAGDEGEDVTNHD